MKVHLEGFRELERALGELPKTVGMNTLRRVARGALEPMADVAAAKAPVRSGRLAYSITVSEKRTKRARAPSRTRFVKGRFRASAATGIAMAMGPASGLGTLQYASFDEFGTIDTPAFGFMRAAWDSGAMKALDYIKDNLAAEIAKAAARQARRRNKT